MPNDHIVLPRPIAVTWSEGGQWFALPDNGVYEKAAAVLFEGGMVWDCILQRWRSAAIDFGQQGRKVDQGQAINPYNPMGAVR